MRCSCSLLLLLGSALRASSFSVPCHAAASGRPAAATSRGTVNLADVGAASTAFYTDEVRKGSYPSMPDVLDAKVADPDLRRLMLTLFGAFATVSAALRAELVVKAEEQKSVFGDVQLGVDVLADQLLWDVCRSEPLIKTGSSEEAPDVRVLHAGGSFCLCWDPLDGSAIVDNNGAVGTIIGVWPAATGVIGATGRDQVASMVANYGPRTTAFATLDDGVYEFTLGVGGVDGWLCSRERVRISPQSRIFSPANLRTARHELPGYGELIDYWLDQRYTLRFCGGLVPDICQQFSKGQGVLTNPPGGDTAPAKLRLAFECAPFSLLVEAAGGKSSDAVTGGSVLDVPIEGIDQRTSIAIGSADEVDRFNALVLPSVRAGPIPYVDGQPTTHGLNAGKAPAPRPPQDGRRSPIFLAEPSGTENGKAPPASQQRGGWGDQNVY